MVRLQILKKYQPSWWHHFFFIYFKIFKKYVPKIPNVHQSISNLFLLRDNPLFGDCSFPFVPKHYHPGFCFRVPSCGLSLLVFPVLTIFNCQLPISPLSPLANISTISPNELFQIISVPLFLLKSSMLLAIDIILNFSNKF